MSFNLFWVVIIKAKTTYFFVVWAVRSIISRRSVDEMLIIPSFSVGKSKSNKKSVTI